MRDIEEVDSSEHEPSGEDPAGDDVGSGGGNGEESGVDSLTITRWGEEGVPPGRWVEGGVTAPPVGVMAISRWDLPGLTLVARMLDAHGRLKPLPRELFAEAAAAPLGLPPSEELVAAVACPACGGPMLRPAASCGLCSPRPRAVGLTARMSTGGRRPGGGGAARGKGAMVGHRTNYKPTVVKRLAKEEARAGWVMAEEVEEALESSWGDQAWEGARVKETKALARKLGQRGRTRCVNCLEPLAAAMLVTCSRECRRRVRWEMNKEQNIEKRRDAMDVKKLSILSIGKKTVGPVPRPVVQAGEGRATGLGKVQQVVDLEVEQEMGLAVGQEVDQVVDVGSRVEVHTVGAVPQTGRAPRKRTLRKCEECAKGISPAGAIPLCPACLAASRAMEQETMACRTTMAAPRARTTMAARPRQSAVRMRSTSVARLVMFLVHLFKKGNAE